MPQESQRSRNWDPPQAFPPAPRGVGFSGQKEPNRMPAIARHSSLGLFAAGASTPGLAWAPSSVAGESQRWRDAVRQSGAKAE